MLRDTKSATQMEYLEALHALRYLEGYLTRLAAENAKSDQIGAMRRVLKEQREKLDTPSLGREQGLAFHALVARAAANKFLEMAVDMIWSWNKALKDLWAHAYPVTGRYSHPDHINIFKAISAGDPAGAEAAMHSHYDVFIEGVQRHFVAEGMPGASSESAVSVLVTDEAE